jgi:hypothetical protein
MDDFLYLLTQHDDVNPRIYTWGIRFLIFASVLTVSGIGYIIAQWKKADWNRRLGMGCTAHDLVFNRRCPACRASRDNRNWNKPWARRWARWTRWWF